MKAEKKTPIIVAHDKRIGFILEKKISKIVKLIYENVISHKKKKLMKLLQLTGSMSRACNGVRLPLLSGSILMSASVTTSFLSSPFLLFLLFLPSVAESLFLSALELASDFFLRARSARVDLLPLEASGSSERNRKIVTKMQ